MTPGGEARVAALAETARAAAAERVCDAVARALPDARVTIEGEGVRVEGRGLLRRWLAEARLRWIGQWLD